jgi:putative Holliday junction resolvase
MLSDRHAVDAKRLGCLKLWFSIQVLVERNLAKLCIFAAGMGRIMAIDYGLKRCGIAVTDELRMIASPLEAVPTHDLTEYILAYCIKNAVDIIVFGKPMQMDGTASDTERQIQPFINHLKKKLPAVKIDRYDERFTSMLAMRAMIDSGSKKSDRKNKGNIDKVSAAIILQDYMNYAK